MCSALLEAGKNLQARGRMIDMNYLTEHIRKLLDRDFVTIRTKQDQVFRHEHSYNVGAFALIDRNSTEPLRVDQLTDLTVDDCKETALHISFHDLVSKVNSGLSLF